MADLKIMSIFGTRPEAIKMAPLVHLLADHPRIDHAVCVTGQHRAMLDQALMQFNIFPDYDLNIMREGQDLTAITTHALRGLQDILTANRPDLIMVHGDTTTAVSAALAAFYQRITVGHVEAGLRSGNMYSPYPEEINRCLISRLASLHFAPTAANAENLRRENVAGIIEVTGNTGIDALLSIVRSDYRFERPFLNSLDFNAGPVILLTAHRRENFGAPLENICRAVRRLAEAHAGVRVIYPVHPNPCVLGTVTPLLDGAEQVMLTEPLSVRDMHNLMARCTLVMTDSGGLQEEAPALGKPVLVLRSETERPEAVEAGTVQVVGVGEEEILAAADRLLTDKDLYQRMATAVNPYGDGRAAPRIVACIEKWAGINV